jgi:hypothetical protein
MMRRGFGIGFLILSILLAVAIGAGAYHVGYVHGLDANGTVQIVHNVGYGGWGFFPFGLFVFPLFLLLFFGFARAAFWGGRWHGHHDDHHDGPMGPGGWGGRGQMFEEWHRRQHDVTKGEPGSSGGEPSKA